MPKRCCAAVSYTHLDVYKRQALRAAIDADRRAGFTPFLLVGTAGTVDTGAIDDLDALATVARAEGLWFHVDGACGALAMLAPSLAPRLKGIELSLIHILGQVFAGLLEGINQWGEDGMQPGNGSAQPGFRRLGFRHFGSHALP